MRRRGLIFMVLSIFVSLLFFGISEGRLGTANNNDRVKVMEAFGKVPLYFIKNEGQVDEKVMYYERGSGRALYFAKDGVHIVLSKKKKSADEKIVEKVTTRKVKDSQDEVITEFLRLRPLHANPQAEIIAEEPFSGKVNYFVGNDPKNWKRDIPTYRKVRYKELYPGIDIVFYGNQRQIEYDIVVKPGADPNVVKFEYEGAKELKITKEGDLLVILPSGNEVIQKKPKVYQEIEGKKVEIDGNYVLIDEKDSDLLSSQTLNPLSKGEGKKPVSRPVYAFKVGEYHKDYPLVIDPLLASTFIGGDDDEYVRGIAIDSSGNIYIAGYAYGSRSTPPVEFPTTPGAYRETRYPNRYYDIFISKFSPDLSTLLASTFFGGSNDDYANAIKIDSQGNVFIAGSTSSSDFPTTPNAYMKTYERNDAFIAKFSSDLSQLLASTFFRAVNGSGYWANEWFLALTIDSLGNVYAVGASDNHGILPPGGYKTERSGLNVEALIVKMSNDLSTLLGATFLGGDKVRDEGVGIAVDSSGNVFVTGTTDYYKENNVLINDFPVTPGAYLTNYSTDTTGCRPSWVAKLNSNLSNLLAATYVGGPKTRGECGYTTSNGYTYTTGIVIDASGNIIVTGYTDTDKFPTTDGAYSRTSKGNNEGFISKYDNNLSSLLASTYIGGSGTHTGGYGDDFIRTITLDSKGNVYIAGVTSSPDYPTTPGAFDTEFGPNENWDERWDVFVSKLDGNLSKLLYSTYIGGRYRDEVSAIAIAPDGNIVIAGWTWTNYTPLSDFPVTSGAYDTTPNGWRDVFVTKLEIPKTLGVQLIGPRIVSPGQDAVYLISYQNGMDKTAKDVVVVVELPFGVEVLSGSEGMIPDNTCYGNRYFWKLGDVAVGEGGILNIEIRVPWGTPSGDGKLSAWIGASNTSNSFDINKYLNYVPVRIQSQTILSEAEIKNVLASNPKIKELLDYAQTKGYFFFNNAKQITFSDGKSLYQFYLINDKRVWGILTASQNVAYIEVFQGNNYTIFDKDGGYSQNRNLGTFEIWGSWAKGGSTSQSAPLRSFLGEVLTSGTNDGFTLAGARCQFNCMLMAIPEQAVKAISSFYSAYSDIKDSYECGLCLGKNPNNPLVCREPCSKVIANVIQRIPEKGKFKVPDSVRKVAGAVDWAWAVYNCLDTCLKPENLKFYECVTDEEKQSCCSGFYSKVLSVFGIDRPEVCTYQCDKLGMFTIFKGSRPCERLPGSYVTCIDGKCEYFEDKPVQRSEKPITVRVARDPNAKMVDISGYVLPGQKLTYTIEYENVGSGTAYGVFILDELDTNLDESTLVINNGGKYSPATRLLSWEVGELPPCTTAKPNVCKGSVSFSVNVKKGLPSGTEITNYAEVHFPSAGEITPTNPVVNIVKSISADPKTVETLSGKPVAITLTGRDSGGRALTYKITANPLYGELTGTPPNVTYTSMNEFIGQDEFYYVVNNGLIDSDPARVTVKVAPNPSDTNPPTVVSTEPEANAANIPVSTTPISRNPDRYAPTISATFSEQIDPSTVTTTTFLVDGLSGSVYYDEQLKTAYFTPSTPLSPSKTYTARLTTGIKDKAGNSMAAQYSWRFSTASLSTCNPPFTDISCDQSFFNEIKWMKDRGISKGWSDGTYRPYEPVTRAAMAVFIVRAMYGDDFTYPTTPYFTDVPPEHQFFKYIQKFKEIGLTKGCNADGTMFCPWNNVRRDEMAVFLVRAKVGDDFTYSETPYFSDVPQGHYFFKYIQKYKELGLTTGYPDGTYRPSANVTRDAMAAFLYRAFGR